MATARVLVVQLAMRVLPEPLSATAEQPLSELAPSRKFTLPVGALPVTVAVKVTLAPAAEGLSELVSVVVVAVVLDPVSVTASMKVVLSLGSVPMKAMVCVPLLATENGMLNGAKLVLAGETRAPIWLPSPVTRIGCAT